MCVFHSRIDSFPDTANTKLVTVTLAENHRVYESSCEKSTFMCVSVCLWECVYLVYDWRPELDFSFSLNEEGFEHALTALVLFSQLSPNRTMKTLAWCKQNIFNLSFSGDTGIQTSSKRQTQLHVLIRLSQHGAMVLWNHIKAEWLDLTLKAHTHSKTFPS